MCWGTLALKRSNLELEALSFSIERVAPEKSVSVYSNSRNIITHMVLLV
jgi:hypothetical protein